MSSLPKINIREVLDWFKGGGLLPLTIMGLFLYAFLSVPAAIFYGRLGVNSGELGITYVGLLSGSTAEIIAILTVLTITFLIVAFLISLVGQGFRLAIIMPRGWRIIFGKPLWELDDEKFEEAIDFFRGAFSSVPEILGVMGGGQPVTFADMEAKERRRRELRRLGVRTEEESVELKEIDTWIRSAANKERMALLYRTRLLIRRRGRLLAICFLTVMINGAACTGFLSGRRSPRWQELFRQQDGDLRLSCRFGQSKPNLINCSP